MTILIDKKALPPRTSVDDYQDEILAIYHQTYNPKDFEVICRIANYPIISYRINHKCRIIFTHFSDNLFILSIMLDHKYERLSIRDLTEKTLKQNNRNNR